MARSLEVASLFEAGLLPRAGGYDDQDALDVALLEIALEVKQQRQQIEARKQQRRRR